MFVRYWHLYVLRVNSTVRLYTCKKNQHFRWEVVL